MSEEGMLRAGGGEDVPLRRVFHDPTMIRSGKIMDSLVRGVQHGIHAAQIGLKTVQK